MPNKISKYFSCKCGFYFITFVKMVFMDVKEALTIPEQITIALDGRTQRWLALEIKMPEDVLSKKMNGKVEFTKEEIRIINIRLKAKIK